MEKFNTNFVSLFEKSGGMVHLEGLELLSSGKEKELSGFANSRFLKGNQFILKSKIFKRIR